jgi:hypothetical protein
MANLSSAAEFAVQSNLAFRAACNGAVRPEERPIRGRVIMRIAAEVKKTPTLLDRVLSKLPEGPIDDHLFAVELAKDPSWQTLVSEFVASEREWNDLLKKSLEPEHWKKVVDWIKSFSHKAGDGERPEVKLASALLVTITGLLAAQKIVLPDLKGVQVQFSAKDPVDVSLIPKNTSGNIPVGLTFEGPDNAMKVKFVGEEDGQGGSPTEALNWIALELNQNRQALKDAKDQIAILAQRTSPFPDLKASLDSLSGNVLAASSNLSQIGGKIDSLSTTYDTAAQKQLKIAQGEVDQIPILYHALQRSTVSVEIAEHSSKAVALQTFDQTTGKLSAASVTISFDGFIGGPDGGRAQIRVQSEDVQLSPATFWLHDGGRTILDGIGYRLTVSALQRYWVLGHKVMVTLTPEIGPVAENRRELKAAAVEKAAGDSVANNDTSHRP